MDTSALRAVSILFVACSCAGSEYDISSDAGHVGTLADASRVDGGTPDRSEEGGTDPADGAVDAARDASTSDIAASDRASSDALGDAVPSDASRGDAPSNDVPTSDVAGDPTAPRFPRTGKYGIVIPPLSDGGTTTSDAGDAGAGDPADVYYPDPPDLHTGSYSFPVVLLLQGAKVARGFYSGVAAAVAGYGFIVVVPDHMSNNIGGPGLYAELTEIAAVGAQMKVEAASATAPVRGVVDTMRIALMGHSYGGASGLSGMANLCFPPILGCAFTRPPELVAGAFYGTNLATPIFGVPALDTAGLPVLLVQGDRDGKALPADAQLTYNQIQKRPKAIVSLLGANHYGVTDVDNPSGADAELNPQTLDHAAGLASNGRWIGVFFAAFLNSDMAARAALRNAGTRDPNVTITLAE